MNRLQLETRTLLAAGFDPYTGPISVYVLGANGANTHETQVSSLSATLLLPQVRMNRYTSVSTHWLAGEFERILQRRLTSREIRLLRDHLRMGLFHYLGGMTLRDYANSLLD